MIISNFFVTIITALASFLLGSIPCGVIVSKVFYGKDVRDTGSGNIGFTNSLRSMGKAGGAAVFIGDFLKGVLAAAIGMWLTPLFFLGSLPFCSNVGEIFAAIATFSATMGHIFCPWLGWKGGKGISTAFGASFVAMNPIAACCLFASFLLVMLATKYVSAGSLTAAVLYPVAAFLTRSSSLMAATLLGITGLVVIWAHRENIARLRQGTERKIGSKKED